MISIRFIHAKNDIAVVMYNTCILPLNREFAIVFPNAKNNKQIMTVDKNVRLIIG